MYAERENGRVGGTRGSGFVPTVANMLEMSVVRGWEL